MIGFALSVMVQEEMHAGTVKAPAVIVTVSAQLKTDIFIEVKK